MNFENDSLKSAYLLIGTITMVLILCGIAIFFSFDSWGDRGSFGDMFGSINALFSGLALAGVIYAILLQRKELSLQREELELTRKELAKAAKAQEKSANLLSQQLEMSIDSKKRIMEKEVMEAEPFFVKDRGGSKTGEIFLLLINKGGEIRNITIEPVSEGYKIKIHEQIIIPKQGKFRITIHSNNGKNANYPFKISYTNKLGLESSQTFDFNLTKRLFSRIEGYQPQGL